MRDCTPSEHSHVGPIVNGVCGLCAQSVTGTFVAPAASAVGGSALDKIIADAIDRARSEAREQVLSSLKGALPDGVHTLVVKEAERLLTTDPEVKQSLRDAMIRALNNPNRSRW